MNKLMKEPEGGKWDITFEEMQVKLTDHLEKIIDKKLMDILKLTQKSIIERETVIQPPKNAKETNYNLQEGEKEEENINKEATSMTNETNTSNGEPPLDKGT